MKASLSPGWKRANSMFCNGLSNEYTQKNHHYQTDHYAGELADTPCYAYLGSIFSRKGEH
jgi:hypothetical protein